MSATPPPSAARPYLMAWFAMRAAGIPDHTIAPVINGAVRRATGLSAVKARVWIMGQLIAADQAEGPAYATLAPKQRQA